MNQVSGGNQEERADGETLAAYLARAGRLPPMQGLALIAQLLSALACAERHGRVHGAIDPAHLGVARNGQLELDIGPPDTPGAARPDPIEAPHHLAPEVASGARPDGRSDLYSAAVVAYQLLTGGLPFAAPGAGVRPVQSLRRDLPAALDDVFRRALARHPQERYPGAAELWAALHGVLGSPVWDRQPVPARSTGTPRGGPPAPPAPAVPIVPRDPGLAPPVPRRAAVALVVGWVAIAFWTAGLLKHGHVPGAERDIATGPAIQALASTQPGPPAVDAAAATLPPPVAAVPTAASPVRSQDDGQRPSTRRPQAPDPAPGPSGPAAADRPAPDPPALARKSPHRPTPRTSPRPRHDPPRVAASSSPARQCRSHEGFVREMCTVLHCATAEFREHPVCVRLHRDAQARLQLAESRGAP